MSHAVLKRAAAGDYRIQPRYGGTAETIAPAPRDAAAALSVLDALARFDVRPAPLYARVDMARGGDGALLLMELELFEPFLFPTNGPQIATLLAEAVKRRLD